MASIAVRMTADVGSLTNSFGQAHQLAESFKTKMELSGSAASRAFAVASTAAKRFVVGAGNVLTHLGRLSSVASASAGILSKLAGKNEELKKKLEGITIALAILAPALSALGPLVAFLSGPIGLVVAAIGAAILIFLKWEAVSTFVVNSAQAVWAKLGEFFAQLWEGIAMGASGLGQILLGAMTFDRAKISAGLVEMMGGFESMKETVVGAASGIASGISGVVDRLADMASAFLSTRAVVEEEAGAIGDEMVALFREQQGGEFAAARAVEMAALTMTAEQALADQRKANADEYLGIIEAGLDAEMQRYLAQEEFRALERELEEERRVAAEEAMALAKQRAIGAAEITAGLFGKEKEFAIAMALIETYMATARALASAPPPASFALAAATLAFGLARVAQIRSTALAEGGIVTRETLATIGEAGPEAVIPLDRLGDGTFGMTEQTIIVMLDERQIAKAVLMGLPSVARIRGGIRTV